MEGPRMSKSKGMTVSAVGLAVLIISIAADYIGVGAGEVDYGNKQIMGTVLGALVFIGGGVLSGRAKQAT